MDMVLGKNINFKIVILIFSNIQIHFCVSAKILYLQRSSADKLYNLAFPHCDKVFIAKI